MKSYQGYTGAADPVRLFSIVRGDEYFSVGTYFTDYASLDFFCRVQILRSSHARDRDHRAPMLYKLSLTL